MWAASCVLLAGCGSSASGRDVAAVRTVALHWLNAGNTGDGQTYCRLLSPRVLVRVMATARQLGPTVTCAQSQSTRPPGMSRQELAQLGDDRRQVSAGFRIDAVSVRSDHAIVRYSWTAPTHPALNLSYNRPVRGRVYDTITLVRLHGAWKIG